MPRGFVPLKGESEEGKIIKIFPEKKRKETDESRREESFVKIFSVDLLQ